VTATAEFVKTFLPTKERVEGIQRIEEPAVPEFVLREAIVNAIAHRDYENPGEILIRIFDDRLELLNPGAPTPEEWKKILTSAIPLHRNPRIYEFLREANLGEGVGQGIPEIKKRLKQAGAGEAVFSIIRDSFNLTIPYKKTRAGSLDELMQKTLEIGLREKKVTSTRVRKELDVSLPLTLRILNELVKQGFAAHKGGGRTSHYEFNNQQN
jgi:ATP-dependent DNA helicase RecG